MERLIRQSMTVHGHELFYVDSGTGSVVLFIHGILGSRGQWEHLVDRLHDDHRVIIPDLFGHGESDKPMGDYSLGAFASGLRDLLAVLDVPSATIVGHSFGGGVAMQLAYQHPELCDRLVLVGSGGLGRDVSWLLRLVTLPGFEYLMPLVFPRQVAELGNGVGRFLSSIGLGSARLGEMWQSYASLAGTEDRKAFLRTIRGVIEPGGQTVNALDRLYLASHLPTLIVWGERDEIIPVHHAHVAHDAIPGSRLDILPAVGHFPHIESPERFLEVLDDFLRTTSPGPTRPARLHDLIRAS